MKMEVRKRNVETFGPESRQQHEQISKDNIKRDPLVQEGLQLYQTARQNGFHQQETVEKSLKCFVRACENGDEEATSWITSFLNSMSAMPPSVVLPTKLVHVMRVLTEASEDEKQVRAVARSLFSKMSGGVQSIPKEKIEESMKNLLSSGEAKQTHTDSQMHSIKRMMHDAVGETEQVDEDTFVETAVNYTKGQVGSPESSGTLDLDLDQIKEFKNANIVKKVFSYPWHTIRYLKLSLWQSVEKRGVRWIWSSIPTKQFYLLLLAYILPMLTVSFIVSAVFTVVFTVAFGSMVLTTIQVMADSQKAFFLAEYSSVLQYFSESDVINPNRSQQRLIRHAIVPYVTFFVSLIIAVPTIGLALQHIVSYELLTVFAAGVSVMVFLQFEMYKSPIIMITVFARSIGMLYVFLLVIDTVFPIPDYTFFIGKDLISFPRIGLHVNVLTFVQIPIQLITAFYLMYTNAGQNFFSGLGPCVVFLCWWLLCRHFLSFSSPNYLIKFTVGVSFLLSMSPFFPLIFLLSPLFFAVYYGISRPFFVSLSFVVIMSILIVFFAANFKRLKEAKWLKLPLDYFFLVPILTCIVLLLFGSSLYASIYEPSSLDIVSVDRYMEYCGPNNWNDGNMVQTQLNCLHLQKRLFEGHGNVSFIKISKVVNERQTSLDSLPSVFKTTLTCLFGQTEPMCGNRKNMTTCVYTGCNFHHSLKYEFEIQLKLSDVEGHDPITISLLASSKYKERVLNITAGMFIRFNASFVDGMGSDKLILKATSLVLPNVVQWLESDDIDEEVKEYLLTNLLVSLQSTIYFIVDIVFGYTPLGHPIRS